MKGYHNEPDDNCHRRHQRPDLITMAALAHGGGSSLLSHTQCFHPDGPAAWREARYGETGIHAPSVGGMETGAVYEGALLSSGAEASIG